jgi:hypothetical protein
MAMSGDLLTILLEDVLEWIAKREKTGILHLYRRSPSRSATPSSRRRSCSRA